MWNEIEPSILEIIHVAKRSKISDDLKTLKRGMPILKAEQALLPAAPKGPAIAALIDHTLLLTQYTPEDVDRACEEALRYGFASVCVNPIFIPQVIDRLQGSHVKPASVVGFIFGAEFPQIKIAQAEQLLEAGVAELDAVLVVGFLKAGRYREVAEDLRGLVDVCHQAGVLCKVILETGLLTAEEKVAGAVIAKYVGADYVKTCTGFAPGEATSGDIRMLRSIAGEGMGVKAAGGVRSYAKAMDLIRAGASRIGATQGVKITEAALNHG